MADWYSKNLATEVAKSNKERSLQGLHNNGAPFGMKKNEDKVLVPDEGEIAGLRFAFELYATGDYSDNEVAHILNEQGYKTKRGRPFSKDTVRDILQNQIYLGKVSYQPCERTEDGERTWTAPVEWFPGQHASVIDEAIFMKCQQVRDRRVRHRKPTTKYNSYLLRNLIYCYQCCIKRPSTNPFPSHGKMRAQAYRKDEYKCYRCRAREMGYVCNQPKVKVEKIDQQVIDILMQLTVPNEWRQKIIRTISELLGEKDLSQRLEEIRAIIKRMDSRWDLGFVTDEAEFLQQRRQLQQELEQLTPLESNQLERATDLFDNFAIYWDGCGSDVEAQAVLLRQVVERVYVEGEKVVAITLRSNCHLPIGQKINGPTEFTVDPFITHSIFAL